MLIIDHSLFNFDFGESLVIPLIEQFQVMTEVFHGILENSLGLVSFCCLFEPMKTENIVVCFH